MKEVTPEGELVYHEQIRVNTHNQCLDKRFLAPNQYMHRKYVFNIDSVLLYFLNGEQTRMLFMFRRLNTCNHRYSCFESILRKFYQALSIYTVMRLPLHFLWTHLSPDSGPSKAFLIAELSTVVAISLLRAGGGCLIRYMHEEVITPQNHR